jgi:hypothetical protein
MNTNIVETRKIASDMMLEHKLNKDLERLVLDAIIEHRYKHESGASTFCRLMRYAKFAMQQKNASKEK